MDDKLPNLVQKSVIVIAVHSNLVDELRIRKEIMEEETGRKARGGLTTFSEMAAHELKLVRMSGLGLMKQILKLQNVPVEEYAGKNFVPYEYFKKLFIYASVLNKRKDQKQIKIEVEKIPRTHKNALKFTY